MDGFGTKLQPKFEVVGQWRRDVVLIACRHHVCGPIAHFRTDVSLKLSPALVRKVTHQAHIVIATAIQDDTIYVILGQVG